MINKTLAIVGCDADEEITTALSSLGFSVQILPRHDSLPTPVRSHADMLMFTLDGCVFAERNYIKHSKSVFDTIKTYGYTIIPCNLSLGKKYPDDIAFNIAICDNVLYGNIKHNACEAIDFAKSKEIKIQSVNQGYTKCSTVILGNKGIVTADSGIAEAAKNNGLEVLKINNAPNAITLNGYDYGFIGGACGVFDRNVYFSGNIEMHPEGELIKAFCQNLGFKTINLTQSKLVDIGGIIFLPYYS